MHISLIRYIIKQNMRTKNRIILPGELTVETYLNSASLTKANTLTIKQFHVVNEFEQNISENSDFWGGEGFTCLRNFQTIQYDMTFADYFYVCKTEYKKHLTVERGEY